MTYLDKINVKGTEYDIQDSKAARQTEVDELKSAITKDITIPSEIWEVGSYNYPDGANYASTSRIRLKKYVGFNLGYFQIHALTGYEFSVYAWSASDNTYIGAWMTGNTFAKAGSLNWVTSFDLTKFKNYIVKVALRNANTPTTSMTVDLAANCVFNNNSVKSMEDGIDRLQSRISSEFDLFETSQSNLLYYGTYNTVSDNGDYTVVIKDTDTRKRIIHIRAKSFGTITNKYAIGIERYSEDGTVIQKLGITQSSILKGYSITLTPATKSFKIYVNSGGTASAITDLEIWESALDVVVPPSPRIFYVESDGSGDFTSLVTAINKAEFYYGSVVYVGSGTWDIIDELGNDYLSGVSDTQRGLYLKNRVHIICDSRAVIQANYTGNIANVKKWLAIFNSGKYGFTLENARLEGSNIRYLIHDERDQDTDAYTNKYINCTMVFDNRNNAEWAGKQCIGGGLGQNGYVDIEGCTFKSYQGFDGTVSYHNTGASTGRSHIVVRDCYFYLYNTFRLSWYGTSTEITDAVVTNCYLGADIVHRAENSSATVENTSIVAWNNTINPHS